MADAPKQPAAPAPLDFAAGVSLQQLPEGAATEGKVGAQDVVAVRQGQQVFVVTAKCTHYGAPMAKGHVAGDQIMCPWHHACFSLRDGATTKAPGLAPLGAFDVTRDGDLVRARPRPGLARRAGVARPHLQRVAIVGAGPAALSAAAELRQQGYNGEICIFGDERRPTYDRTKLSKAFLASDLPADQLTVNTDFLLRQGADAAPIRWQLGTQVVGLSLAEQTLLLAPGPSGAPAAAQRYKYDALLLATGARAKLPAWALEALPKDAPKLLALRNLADAQAVRAAARTQGRVVIVGASFIGLEAAAVLRQRGLDVTVLARLPQGALPMQHILGRDVAEAILHLHRQKGVHLRLDAEVTGVGSRQVRLQDGQAIAADWVLLATGVTPNLALAEGAGLACDNGIRTNAQLETTQPGVWAAGDVASFPAEDGSPLRIEHWAHAEQMGRVAARNLLGAQEPFRAVPFFWTEHFDMKIRYVGHTRTLTHAETFGDIEKRRAAVALHDNDRIAAVLTIGADDISMPCEFALANGDQRALRKLLASL